MFSDIEESGMNAARRSSGRRRVLFFLPNAGYVSGFESLLKALSADHEVIVALDREKGDPEDQQGVLTELTRASSDFRYRELSPRRDPWLVPSTAVRRRLDYLRSIELGVARYIPETEHADGGAPLFRFLMKVPPFS